MMLIIVRNLSTLLFGNHVINRLHHLLVMPSLLIHQEDINIPTRPVIRFRIVKRTTISLHHHHIKPFTADKSPQILDCIDIEFIHLFHGVHPAKPLQQNILRRTKLRRHFFQGIKGNSQHPLLPCQPNHLLPIHASFPLPFRRITKRNSQ